MFIIYTLSACISGYIIGHLIWKIFLEKHIDEVLKKKRLK